jgi:hypothetical protein
MHRRIPALIRFTAAVFGSAALALGSLGCGKGEAPRHVRADPATSVPSDIEFYGHVLYGGEDAYLVDGRWYRPAATGWVVFTEEPIELELLRKTLEPKPASLFGL